MNYTILKKGNWVTEGWKVYADASSKAEASALAEQARSEYPRVTIKAHRKTLSALTDAYGRIHFSDGTTAWDDREFPL